MSKKIILSLIVSFFVNIIIAQTSQPKLNLGNGYQNAKWGMTKEQVISSLSSDRFVLEESSDSTYLTFKIDGIKEISCLFYSNKFYSAIYEPKCEDNDDKGAQAVLIGLQKKYGSGKNITGYVDGMFGINLILVVWDDGITEIKYKIWDPKAAAQLGMNYPSSTLKVIYTSKKIQANKDKQEKEEKMRIEREERNKKVKNVENDL